MSFKVISTLIISLNIACLQTAAWTQCDMPAKESMRILAHQFSLDFTENPELFSREKLVNLTGANQSHHLNAKIARSLDKFLKQYEWPEFIKSETVVAIQNLVQLFYTTDIQHSLQNDPDELFLEAALDQSTYSVPLNVSSRRSTSDNDSLFYSGHYVSICVCGNYISFNNRGSTVYSEKPGITIYSIKGKQDLFKSIKEKFIHKNTYDGPDPSQLFDEVVHIPMPPQSAGNCSWASAKADLLAHLFFIFAQVQYGVELDQLNHEQIMYIASQAKKVYYHWALFDRLQAYNDYINELDDAPDCLASTAAVLLNKHYETTSQISPHPFIENLELPNILEAKRRLSQLNCKNYELKDKEDHLNMITAHHENQALMKLIGGPLNRGTNNIPSNLLFLKNQKAYSAPLPLDALPTSNLPHEYLAGVMNKNHLEALIDAKAEYDVFLSLLNNPITDGSATTSTRQSLVQYAMDKGMHPEILSLLIESGGDPFTKSSAGEGVLKYMIENDGYYRLFRSALKRMPYWALKKYMNYKADTSVISTAWEGVLEAAVSKCIGDNGSLPGIIQLFIDHRADIHVKTTTGQNLLEYAKDCGCSAEVLSIIEAAMAKAAE